MPSDRAAEHDREALRTIWHHDVTCSWYAARMSIAVQVHANEPAALAELIERAMHDNGLIDREPQVAHLSVLVDAEERELQRRREAWQWLNSLSNVLDKDNDWSDV